MAVARLEEFCTPLEFAEARRQRHHLPPSARRALSRSIAIQQLGASPPEPYSRSEIAPDVTLYRAADGPASEKHLLVGFTGAARRLMLPIATFLQNLPAAGHDVVVLVDRSRTHYANGIENFATDLKALTDRVLYRLEAWNYRSVVTIGASMGGFPALRAGLLAGADRGISLGGRTIWHPSRLKSAHRQSIEAFDPLCSCGPKGASLHCLYAEANEEDRVSVEELAAMRSVERVAFATARHNILFQLWESGALATTLSDLITGRRPIRSEGRPEAVAAPG